MTKQDVTDEVVEKYVESWLGRFVTDVRTGWNAYSFLFYIGGISALLGGVFGWVGGLSVVATLLFFYFAGRFTRRVEAVKRREEEDAKRKHRSTRR